MAEVDAGAGDKIGFRSRCLPDVSVILSDCSPEADAARCSRGFGCLKRGSVRLPARMGRTKTNVGWGV